MQQTCVFNCFMFCFLLVIYMADSSPDSISDSNEANIVKLGDTADGGKSDDDVAIDDENPDEAVADQTMPADGNDPVQDDDQDKNEPIDDGNENYLQGDVQHTNEQMDGVDAEDDVPGDNEPIVGEEKANEEQDDAPVEDESINTGVQDDTVTDDKKNGDQSKLYNGTYTNKKAITTDRKLFYLSPAEIEKFKIWPNGTVSYYIDEFSYDKVLRDKIRSYLDYVELKTMVHFHELAEPPTDEDERWVFFVNRRGLLDCKDYSTKSFTFKGVQKVTVGYNCLKHGGPMAAIVLALLGVPPQHNSPNRDKFITVATEHILPEKLGLFSLLRDDEWLFHDLQYDYTSAGHYPSHKYTADGSRTISTKPDGFDTRYEDFENILNTEEVKDYSDDDLRKIDMLYGNILLKQYKVMKLDDCKAFYRPGPGFGNTRLTKPKEISKMPKPTQYLDAVKKLYGEDIALFVGETLSSLESK
ncbi:zinc metalloproteinase nas-8-like [Cydia pomonella]|uniref:zinc metalloproteinase nas-8-like n=1 Tax=Cydia pomonella TaxID=82600 RepID=UPI002ADE3F66|nr:zinc metalloproteinase nas-8-like [Cydia pomonella]